MGDRAAFSWFIVEPGWFESKIDGMAQAEAQAVALFTQMLTLERPESNTTSSQDDMPHCHSSRSGSLTPITTTYTQVFTHFHYLELCQLKRNVHLPFPFETSYQ